MLLLYIHVKVLAYSTVYIFNTVTDSLCHYIVPSLYISECSPFVFPMLPAVSSKVMTFDLSVGLDTITCMLYMLPKITPLIDIKGLHWQILDSIHMTDSTEENVSLRKINKRCF